MSVETKLISYLQTYGNTKESDLIEYGMRILGQTRKGVEKVLDKMVAEGNARQIIHDKLEPNVVYVARGELIAVDLALQVEADALGINDKDKVIEEARRILEEATAVAQKRIRRKYPGIFK